MEKIKEYWQKAKQFLREVRVELKKVTWPSRKETIASTSVVLITVFLISFFLGIVDLGLSRFIKIFLD
jgi:preprotein translocase subunit SecE